METASILDANAPKQSQTFQLRDGRTLGFAEYGAPHGIPIFFMHGFVGSRLDASEWHETAVTQGARLICIDRPGIGLSTFQPKRRLLDLPGDIRQLAHHLSIGSYYVCGQSGGGPYALACAHAIPKEELKGVACVAGPGPWSCGSTGMAWPNRIFFWLLGYTPLLVRPFVSCIYGGVYNADQEKLEKSYQTGLKIHKKRDREVLSKPETMKGVIATLREGFRQGNDGFMQEGSLVVSDWGFKPEDVVDQKILLFHGTADENVPISHARYLSKHLPQSELTEFEGETHHTMSDGRYPSIMARLLSNENRQEIRPHE